MMGAVLLTQVRLSRSLALLVIAFLAASPLLGSVPSKKTVTYHDEKCGYHFEYPAGWAVEKDEECDFTISPTDLAERLKSLDVDVWSIEVLVHEGTFLAEAADAGFDFQRGRWSLGGFDFRNGEAGPFAMPPWWGLRGSSSVRCYHPQGGNAGFCNALTVVMQSATVLTGDARIVRIKGHRQARDTIDVIIRTFRFDFPR
jgi:hypothetical protein